MQNKLFLKAADICELLEVKQTSAYEIIGNLNKELQEQGYLTLKNVAPKAQIIRKPSLPIYVAMRDGIVPNKS